MNQIVWKKKNNILVPLCCCSVSAAHVAKKTNEVLPAVDRARRLMEVSQLIRPWIIIMLGEREKKTH